MARCYVNQPRRILTSLFQYVTKMPESSQRLIHSAHFLINMFHTLAILYLSQLWPLRENYRADVEKKNAALQALLKRAKDAIQIIKDIENPPLDPKAKKKK